MFITSRKLQRCANLTTDPLNRQTASQKCLAELLTAPCFTPVWLNSYIAEGESNNKLLKPLKGKCKGDGKKGQHEKN